MTDKVAIHPLSAERALAMARTLIRAEPGVYLDEDVEFACHELIANGTTIDVVVASIKLDAINQKRETLRLDEELRRIARGTARQHPWGGPASWFWLFMCFAGCGALIAWVQS